MNTVNRRVFFANWQLKSAQPADFSVFSVFELKPKFEDEAARSPLLPSLLPSPCLVLWSSCCGCEMDVDVPEQVDVEVWWQWRRMMEGGRWSRSREEQKLIGLPDSPLSVDSWSFNRLSERCWDAWGWIRIGTDRRTAVFWKSATPFDRALKF